MINVRQMDALTLIALAEELEREERFYEKVGDADASARAQQKARLYRKRARLAKGGWAVVQQPARERT